MALIRPDHLVPSNDPFSGEDMRQAMKELIPVKMKALGIPITEANVGAIRIESEHVGFLGETRFTVRLREHVLLSHEEVAALRAHLTKVHAWDAPKKESFFAPTTKNFTPDLDTLTVPKGTAKKLLGIADEDDPFEGSYIDNTPPPPATLPPLLPEEIKVAEGQEVVVSIRKKKRKLG